MPGFGNHFSTEAAGYEGKVLPVGQNNPQKASVLWRYKHVGSTQQRYMLYVHAPGRFRLVCRTIERDRIYSATQSQQAKVPSYPIFVKAICTNDRTFSPCERPTQNPPTQNSLNMHSYLNRTNAAVGTTACGHPCATSPSKKHHSILSKTTLDRTNSRWTPRRCVYA